MDGSTFAYACFVAAGFGCVYWIGHGMVARHRARLARELEEEMEAIRQARAHHDRLNARHARPHDSTPLRRIEPSRTVVRHEYISSDDGDDGALVAAAVTAAVLLSTSSTPDPVYTAPDPTPAYSAPPDTTSYTPSADTSSSYSGDSGGSSGGDSGGGGGSC